MRIALVHDFLVQDGGAERVLKALHDVWPDAPTFTLLYDPALMPASFRARDIRTTFLQRLPLASTLYKSLLPLMPAAVEGFDLSGYDVILSSASAFAKGAITHPGQLHLCYCHTPTRYLWSDAHNYLQELGVPAPVRATLPLLMSRLRTWDRQAAGRVDKFVANSETVRGRIAKYYGRPSAVIAPPVDTHRYRAGAGAGGYFLAGGRLVPYKRFDVVVRAFNKLGLPLRVFGVGPESARLRAMAGPNITFLGRVREQDKPQLYADAVAYINPQEEDFGITAVEAMAAGRPVLAFGRGGGAETVVDGVTGVHMEEQTWEELAGTVLRFDPRAFDPARIRAHALQYDVERFKKEIKQYVDRQYAAWVVAGRRDARAADAVNLNLLGHEAHRDRHPTHA